MYECTGQWPDSTTLVCGRVASLLKGHTCYQHSDLHPSQRAQAFECTRQSLHSTTSIRVRSLQMKGRRRHLHSCLETLHHPRRNDHQSCANTCQSPSPTT